MPEHTTKIPVASHSSGDFISVDLYSERGGKSGKVISFLHAESRHGLLAKDFKASMTQFADDLKAAKYYVKDGWLTDPSKRESLVHLSKPSATVVGDFHKRTRQSCPLMIAR